MWLFRKVVLESVIIMIAGTGISPQLLSRSRIRLKAMSISLILRRQQMNYQSNPMLCARRDFRQKYLISSLKYQNIKSCHFYESHSADLDHIYIEFQPRPGVNVQNCIDFNNLKAVCCRHSGQRLMTICGLVQKLKQFHSKQRKT